MYYTRRVRPTYLRATETGQSFLRQKASEWRWTSSLTGPNNTPLTQVFHLDCAIQSSLWGMSSQPCDQLNTCHKAIWFRLYTVERSRKRHVCLRRYLWYSLSRWVYRKSGPQMRFTQRLGKLTQIVTRRLTSSLGLCDVVCLTWQHPQPIAKNAYTLPL